MAQVGQLPELQLVLALELKPPVDCSAAAAACAALSRSLTLQPRDHAAEVWGHLAPLADALERLWAPVKAARAQRGASQGAWLALGTEVCLLIGSLARLPPPALALSTASLHGDAFGALLSLLCDACGATSPLPLVAAAAGMLCTFDWIPPVRPLAMHHFMGAAYSALRVGLRADPAALGGRECVEQGVWLLDRIVRKSGEGAAAAKIMKAAAAAAGAGGAGAASAVVWRDWPLTLVRVLLRPTHAAGRLLLHSPQPFSPGRHIIDVILPAACAYLDGMTELRGAIGRELTFDSPGYEVLLRALTSRSSLRASAAYASIGACLRLLGPAAHQKAVARGGVGASQQDAAASLPHETEDDVETATDVRGKLASVMWAHDSKLSNVLLLLISTVAEAPGVCMPGAVRGAQLAALRVFLDAAAAFTSAKDDRGALQLHTTLSELIDGIAWSESDEEGGAPQLAALPVRLEALRARVEVAAVLAASCDDASADAILQAAVAALLETVRIELRAEREGPVSAVVAFVIGALMPARDSLHLSRSEASARGLGAEFGRRERPPAAFTFHCAHFLELPESGPSYLFASVPRLLSPTPSEIPLVARAVKLLFDCLKSDGGSTASATKEAAARAYGVALASADKVATAATSRNPDRGRGLRADISSALEPEAKGHPLLEDALKRMPAGVAPAAGGGGEAAVPSGSALGKRTRDEEAPAAPSAPAAAVAGGSGGDAAVPSALGKRTRDEEAPAPSAPAAAGAVSDAALPSEGAASKVPRAGAPKSRSKRGVLEDEDD